jgi:hypothetical protein
MKLFEVTPDPSDHPVRKNPDYVKKHYFGVLNVSDSPCSTFNYALNGIMSLWVPIHEVGIWGYAPFYVAAKMLDLKQQMQDSRPILLHCHAGVNRSRCVAHAVLSAEGNCQKEIDELDVLQLFAINMRKGYIPEDIHLMLAERKKHATFAIHGLLQSCGSEHTFYHKNGKPKLKFNGVEL